MLRFLRKEKKSCAFPLCYDLVVILNKGFIKGSGRDRNLKESNRLISKVIFKKLYYTGSYYFNEKHDILLFVRMERRYILGWSHKAKLWN